MRKMILGFLTLLLVGVIARNAAAIQCSSYDKNFAVELTLTNLTATLKILKNTQAGMLTAPVSETVILPRANEEFSEPGSRHYQGRTSLGQKLEFHTDSRGDTELFIYPEDNDAYSMDHKLICR